MLRFFKKEVTVVYPDVIQWDVDKPPVIVFPKVWTGIWSSQLIGNTLDHETR